SIFGNSGQVCAAGSRLYVHEDVADQVIEGIAGFAKNLKLGAGLDEGTQLGPLISEVQRERVLGYIKEGIADGAELVAGGLAEGDEGFFVQPTVLKNVNPDMSIAKEEIFGPVLSVSTFGDEDSLAEVLRRANNTEYGLNSVIF